MSDLAAAAVYWCGLISVSLFFYFVRCSTLNCEVVLELLSSKLQDPSNTVKMVTRPTKDPSFFLYCNAICSYTFVLPCDAEGSVCCVVSPDI